IVLRPVSYLLFRFPHVITALTITKDQIAGLGKGSTDLGNNALSHPNYVIFSVINTMGRGIILHLAIVPSPKAFIHG
ncbi:hypothetical protein, partial [Vibrio sp. S12_S33]|uniref:hypothetical protein n=1 Tax=Vibrio sp. S12_S33 TaxID=2720223 RepID=UPI001EE2A45A